MKNTGAVAARPLATAKPNAARVANGDDSVFGEGYPPVANAPLPDSLALRTARDAGSETKVPAAAASTAQDSPSPKEETAAAPNDAPTGKTAAGDAKAEAPARPAEDETDTAPHEPTDPLADAYASWHAALASQAGEIRIEADAPGVVDLSHPHPTGGAQLFSGKPTRLKSLIREENAQRTALKRMGELSRRVEELADTYGYAPVTLAIGRLVWSELPESVSLAIKFGGGFTQIGNGASRGEATRGGTKENASSIDANDPAGDGVEVRQMNEPALLQSARLEIDAEGDARITLTKRCKVNPVVLRAFESHSVPSEQITQLCALAADSAHNDEAVARIRELGRLYLPGFSYHVSSLLGAFAHPGSVLLEDLEAMRPYIEESGIMRALAGDEATRALSSQPLPPASREDRSPETERGAGDLDVVELGAVEGVAAGRSLVIDTPTGSRGTGTLAAIVADAAATGRSVLYIPGRQASGRSFIDEMERLGLGELVLDFSDVDAAAWRLRTGMRLREPELADSETLRLRDDLSAARARLGEYVRALHETDEEWDVSVHSLLQRMAALMTADSVPGSRVRLPADQARLLGTQREAIAADFREASRIGALESGKCASPWAGSRITADAQGAEALSRARLLATETVPVAIAQAHRVAAETGLARAATLNEWLSQITLLDAVASTLDVFVPAIYEHSAYDMITATATKEWREENNRQMSMSERRRLTRQARGFLRDGIDVADLHDALAKVEELRDIWRRYRRGDSWPKLPDGLPQIKVSASEVVRELKALETDLAPGTRLEEMSLEDMHAFLRRLATDEASMVHLPRRNELLAALDEKGMASVIADFTARRVTEDMVDAELELIYCASVFEQLVGRSDTLSTIGSAELASLARDVRILDKAHTETLAGPVMRGAISRMRQTISARRDDTMTLDGQLERYSTGMLAESIRRYADIVQASRPVWVIPAMMVAEFVPTMPWADLVIMDAMDSVPVANSVSMLMRGSQIVVVGDVRRGGENCAIARFAKVLPVVELPANRVRHDELATATLREQGYADVLEMIPAVRMASRVKLVVVDGRGFPSPASGMVEGTAVEVDKVVDAVVEHILTRPEKSLAVACISQGHAERVREALKQTVRGSSVLQQYLARDSREPFAILDVTQCAGLQRDSVILSVGFGKTVHGRVVHTFGALSEREGLSGLVDAVEAAREDLTIISALGPGDIRTDGVAAAGPRLLARIIDRAGGEAVGIEPDANSENVTPLVGDLAARLERKGWATATNYGYDDGVRIPLVAGSEGFEGTWRVAVLVDDEEYVNEPSMRRRDRFWLERLEERGWIVFRTFSTSLFIDPVGQAQAISALLESIRDAPEPPASVDMPALAEGWQHALRAESSQIRNRSRRPAVTPGLPLAAYSDDELDELVAWIMSDGRRRTEDQILATMREELDVPRCGTQIDAVLRNVIRRLGLASDDISSALSVPSAGDAPAEASADEARDDAPDTADAGSEDTAETSDEG